MPDFVTPTIMMTKLKDIIKLAEKPNAVEGPGRGRKKKNPHPENEAKPTPKADETAKQEEATKDEEKVNAQGAEKKASKGNIHPTRTLLKKINKFMNDLAGLMEGVFEDIEDDNLPQSDKTICQNLLLMVSVKEKIFSSEQRTHARKMLKRLEGDRRRRCRTNGDEGGRHENSICLL